MSDRARRPSLFRSLGDAPFCLLCLFIAAVSVYDAWLVVKYGGVILDIEQNPFCSFLIEADTEGFSVFLRAKTAGTLTVLALLAAIHLLWRRWAFPIAGSVAAFQFALLLYLTLDLPKVEMSALQIRGGEVRHHVVVIRPRTNPPLVDE